MKKGLIGIGILVLIGIALYGFVVNNYNRLVGLDEGVKQAWASVENQYQRRADLIPNIVQTVQGYADYEYSVLTEVTEARAKATQMTVDIKDAASMAQYQQAQGEISSMLSRLMVANERYPELQSSKLFSDLQVQLEGTENRITTERGRYNEVVKGFNVSVRTFPTNIIANLFGFERAMIFEAEAGAEQAPDVDFDFSARNAADDSVPVATNTQVDEVIEVADATQTE